MKTRCQVFACDWRAQRPRLHCVTMLALCVLSGCPRLVSDDPRPAELGGLDKTPEGGELAMAGASHLAGNAEVELGGVDQLTSGEGAQLGGVEVMGGSAILGSEESTAGVTPLMAGTEAPLGGEHIQRSPPIVLQWALIEGGRFAMGTEGGDPAEGPVRSVRVTDFELSVTEVTVAQYKACMEAGRCSEPARNDGCHWEQPGRDNHPVNCVDWGQARTFAKWIGDDVDLPTEAEWEYAARGGENLEYAGSDDPDEVAWYLDNSGGTPHSVAIKISNGYGLYDMSGNLREWVLDEWHENYIGAPEESDEPWGMTPPCSPVCSSGFTDRLSRGGSWNNIPIFLRTTHRRHDPANSQLSYLGFRVRRAPR